MKLAILIGLLLTVNTMPAESTEKPEGADVPVGIKEVPMNISEEVVVDIEEMEGMEDNTTIDIDGNPNAHFLEEVEKYFQQHKLRKSPKRATRQISGGLFHGTTVALQSFVRDQWLGCSSSLCGRFNCPRMYMTGADWINCGGEVFQIYRANGPGAVRVGDLVGLYYGGGTWLGCSGRGCWKAPCPGRPSTAYGFAIRERWFICSGEVFKIYARGKGSGSTINSGDDIGLYYLQRQLWVAQGYSQNTVKNPCLGTSRPPPLSQWDGCAFETFRVWKR